MIGQHTIAAPPLEEAAAEALLHLATEGEVIIVIGRDAGPAARCVGGCPERVVVAPGTASRLAVADGVWIAGRRVVTILDSRPADLRAAAAGRHPNVLLTTHAAHLAAARDAGLVVVQPSWPDDVEPLLRDALAMLEPVLVRLHTGAADGPAPERPPELGSHRVLCRGRAGLLVAAGPGTPLLVDVAVALKACDVEVTAVEMHTIRPSTGIDPARTDSVLLVGPAGIEEARELVPVPFGAVEQVTDAVLAALSH